jgi:hypothetical protein
MRLSALAALRRDREQVCLFIWFTMVNNVAVDEQNAAREICQCLYDEMAALPAFLFHIEQHCWRLAHLKFTNNFKYFSLSGITCPSQGLSNHTTSVQI